MDERRTLVPVRGALMPLDTPRSCVTRGGREKRKFLSRSDARQAARNTALRSGDHAVRAYRCGNCTFYHVGHPLGEPE